MLADDATSKKKKNLNHWVRVVKIYVAVVGRSLREKGKRR
jgi:hypothetical protein